MIRSKLLYGVVVVILLLTSLAAIRWRPDVPLDVLIERWGEKPSLFVDVGGIRVHYRDEGPRDSAVPILLLHGTDSSLHTWQAWVDRMRDSQRLVRLDLPGSGLTELDPTEDYGYSRRAEVTQGFLERIGIERAVVVGAGSGGRVAIELATRHPDRVDRLVLIAPEGYPSVSALPLSLRILVSRVGRLALRVLPRPTIKRLREGHHAVPPHASLESIDRNLAMMFREGTAEAVISGIRAVDSLNGEIIRNVRQKTLILWGARDNVIPSANAQRFLADIPNSRLRVFPNVGHFPEHEVPGESTDRVVEFLQE